MHRSICGKSRSNLNEYVRIYLYKVEAFVFSCFFFLIRLFCNIQRIAYVFSPIIMLQATLTVQNAICQRRELKPHLQGTLRPERTALDTSLMLTLHST